jgi:hypothetical protein
MNEQKQETRKDADTESRPPTNQIVLGDVEGSVMKKTGTVEYPELKGKVIEQVRYKSDSDSTVLVIEFNDNTRASFRLRADVSFALEPEMSGNDAAGDIANWKVLKTRSLPPRFKQRE